MECQMLEPVKPFTWVIPNAAAASGQPVIVEVSVDYSKRTAFTEGVVKTNFKRFIRSEQVRAVTRALRRRITG